MKFSRTAAVIGAAVVLVGGGAVAVNAATSGPDTVSLCVNSNTGSVGAPRNGGCVSGNVVTLPSNAAFQALKDRVTTTEQNLATTQQDLATANQKIADLQGQQPVVTGTAYPLAFPFQPGTAAIGGWTFSGDCNLGGVAKMHVTAPSGSGFLLDEVTGASSTGAPPSIDITVPVNAEEASTHLLQEAHGQGAQSNAELTLSVRSGGSRCDWAIKLTVTQ